MYPNLLGGGGSSLDVEPDILNKEAFIYYDENNIDDFVKKIKLLWEDEEEYEKFINIPPFKENAVDVIYNKFQELKNKIQNM